MADALLAILPAVFFAALIFFNSALVIVVFVVFTAAVLVVVVIAIKERRCKHALSLPDDPDHFAGLFDESVSKACGLLLG